MWEEKRLGEYVKINPESITSKDNINTINYIDIASVTVGVLAGYQAIKISEAPSRAKRKIKDNDFIFSTVRPNLRAYYYVKNVPINAIASTGFAVIRAKKNCDSRFMYYLLTENSFVDYLTNVAKGTAYPAVDTKDFLRAKLSIPPLPIQRKITDVLSAYDDLIENNNRRIRLLEQATQQLYKEWFLRFRFPGYETVHFTKWIPDGWEVKKLSEIVDIIDGDRGANYPNQNEMFDIGYCLFLNAGNVTINGFNFSSNAFITKEKDEKLRKGKLNRDDIVLSTRGTVGNVALYNNHLPFDDVRINSGMVIIRPINCSVNPAFLYLLLRSSYVQQLITLYASGSAQPQLPIKDMKQIKILVPLKEILIKFEEVIKPMLETISNYMTINQNLIKQRDLLLPRLMSGKIEV